MDVAEPGVVELLAARIRGARRIAVADGVGAPTPLLGPLSHVARAVPDLSAVLGWCPGPLTGFDPAAFADVRALMGGYGVRRWVREGSVRYVPVRLGTAPSLLRGSMPPDVLIAALRPAGDGFAFGSEVGWMGGLAAAGVPILAEVNHALPAASAEPPIPGSQVTVVVETARPPAEVPPPDLSDTMCRIGRHVAALVPAGAAVQVGPGQLAEATLAALEVEVHVDSGLLVDGVVGLAERGLLLSTPSAAYLAGSERLYRWADGQPLLRGLEHSHDLGRLVRRPLAAVNTALEIDRVGQVNVEGMAGDVVAGIGGHPDFAVAASRSGGLSIVAVPSTWQGRSTLVERLSAPVSTPRADVDVVVNEAGVADLRGLDDGERTAALDGLWDRAGASA